jgi:hypothetical protein
MSQGIRQNKKSKDMKKIYILLIAILLGGIANAQNWQSVGPNCINMPSQKGNGSYSMAISNNGTPFVFIQENYNYFIKNSVRKFDGTNWINVGNPNFSSTYYSSNRAIAIDNNGNPLVAFSENISGDVKVMKYNGNTWDYLGTPGFTCVYNDIFPMVIDNNGIPYIAFNDNTNNKRISVKKYNGTNWVYVGNAGFSAGSAEYLSLKLDVNGIPYIAYRDNANYYKASVMKFNGSNWVNVGNAGFSDGNVFYTSITIDTSGTPFVVYKDSINNNKATVKKYNGNSWVNVGNAGLVSYPVNYTSIVSDISGNLFIGFKDTTNLGSSTVMKYNGNTWVTLGSAGFSGNGTQDNNLLIDNNGILYMASKEIRLYNDNWDYEFIYSVMKFNGTQWVNVGEKGIADLYNDVNSIAIDSIGNVYLAFSDNNANQKISVKKYDGNNWTTVGNQGFSSSKADHVSIALNKSGIPYVVYRETANGEKATVKKFNGTSWVNVGNAGLANGYGAAWTQIAIDSASTPYVVFMQKGSGNYDYTAFVTKFNGSNWVNVGSNNASEYGQSAYYTKIAIDDNTGTPYILYHTTNNMRLIVRKFNGTAWETIGNSFFINPTANKHSIAIDNNSTPYIAYASSDSGLIVKKFNGSNWLNVGMTSIAKTDSVDFIKLAISKSGIPYLTYTDITDKNFKKAVLKYFNGNNWVNIPTTDFSNGNITGTILAINNNNLPYLAYKSFSFAWVKKYFKCTNPTYGGVISANQSICLGTTPLMLSNTQNSSGFMGSQVYKWQKSTISDTSGFTDIAGATGLTYQPSSLNVNTWFRRLANVSCSSNWIDSAAISNVIKIKVDSFPVTATAAAISGSTTVCQGQTNVAYTVPVIANASSYIWTLPSGATTTTNTTNTIYVNYGSSAVSGNITVKGHSGCGNGGSSSLAVTVSPLPVAAATITGLNSVCPGQSSVTYSIPAIANATSYIWTLPAGATGTSTTNTITVNYDSSAVSGNISVFGVNSCGNGASSIKAITVSMPVAAGNITGGISVCPGYNHIDYTISPITNATSYIWTLPTGATGSSTSNTISVNYGSSAISGNIIVKGHSSCGDCGSSSLAITVNPLPDSAGIISGLTTVCEGQTSVTYTIPAIANATSYYWSLPPNSTATYTANSITVNYANTTTSGQIKVKGSNSCGYGASSSLAITVIPIPSQAGFISGASPVCRGQSSVTYSIPVIPSATSYIWTLPAGATGTSNTNTITVNYSSSAVSGTLKVYGANSCGNGYQSNRAITVINSTPNATGSISGAQVVCPNQTSVIYTVPAISNATSYIWTLPTGATGSSTANTITVNYGASATSGNITVKGSNSCGIGDSSILAVAVNLQPGAAGVISGITTLCQGQSSITYTTPAIANATSYSWTLPSGVTGNSATNSITVNFGNYAVSGNITVKGVSACGVGIPSSLFVNVNPLPSSSGFISGATNVCKGQTNIYSVSPIANANSYIWTLPSGVIGASDSNSINGYFGLTATNGNITVKGINSCGIGATSAIAIYVNPTPSAAGNITGQTNVCQGQNSIIYSVTSIANAAFYEWTLPTGVIGLSSIDTIYVDYSNTAISGNITVKGINSNCYGDSSSLAVIVNLLPSSASLITGTTNVTAAQQNVQYSIPAIANATSYLWLLPNGATGTSTTNTISVNYSSSAVSGNITVKGINSCGIGDSSSLYVTVNPFIPNCSAQFDLVADTAVLHHYFAVNNASGVPPLQYNWSWGDGSFSITAYPTHTYSASGNYKICLTIIDSVGCTTTYCDSSYLQKDPNAIISVQVIPQGTLGISSLLSDKIKIYPNPAKDNLIVELIRNIDLRNNTISFYNIAGQLIKQLSTKQAKTEIDIHDFPAGLYVVKVNNEKESFISKFVKE